MEITVFYRGVDGYSKTRRFKTLRGAQRFAHKWIGEHPEIGTGYAVSPDGVGRITVDGVSLSQLFPPYVPEPQDVCSLYYDGPDWDFDGADRGL